MTRWIVYATAELAEAAQADIAAAMGLGRLGMVTTRWADPRQTAGGQWAIPSPDDEGDDEPAWPESATP